MELKRAALAGIAVLFGTACAAQQSAPIDVVTAYFASLGRDPIRSLPLTTETFHRAHGLSVVAAPAADASRGDADRARVAWLAVQDRADFVRIASGLVAAPGDAQEAGDVATVTVTVTPAHAAAFVQIFRLVRRDPDSAWQIDAIEQRDVVPANEVAAFVAHPTERARRALEARARPPAQPRRTPR